MLEVFSPLGAFMSTQLDKECKTITPDLPKIKLVQKDKEAYSEPRNEEVTKLALNPRSLNPESMLIIITSDIITRHRNTEISALPTVPFNLAHTQLNSMVSLTTCFLAVWAYFQAISSQLLFFLSVLSIDQQVHG